jgi:hypothetical protein
VGGLIAVEGDEDQELDKGGRVKFLKPRLKLERIKM